jgi:23S rRNA (uracil1939-C5)-methyltransferase
MTRQRREREARPSPKTTPDSLSEGAFAVEVVDLDASGVGVAQSGGREVMVPGAFPGERVLVDRVARSRHRPLDFSKPDSLLVGHANRRAAPCPHHADHLKPFATPANAEHGACTGCPLQSLELQAQVRELAHALHRRFGWNLGEVITDGREWGYRWSAKRVCHSTANGIHLGSHRLGSHEFAVMDQCLVDHPLLVQAFGEVQHHAQQAGVIAFDEKRGSGDLRYVWGKTNGQQVLLTLISANEKSRAVEVLPARLSPEIALAWSVQVAKGNAIRGTPPVSLRGPDTFEVEFFGESRSMGPLGFLQPNPPVAALAYEALLSDESGQRLRGELAFDLYAGAGLTTSSLRQHFKRVIPCESYPESAKALGVEAMDSASFLTAIVADAHAPRPDLIVANPPRAGLGAAACEALVALAVPRLNIMSCNATTLAADLQALAPAYEVVSLRAYATLPHTPHLELIAHLRARISR